MRRGAIIQATLPRYCCWRTLPFTPAASRYSDPYGLHPRGILRRIAGRRSADVLLTPGDVLSRREGRPAAGHTDPREIGGLMSRFASGDCCLLTWTGRASVPKISLRVSTLAAAVSTIAARPTRE